jgi:tetratricopeptide (TPR) repeat protein
VLAVLSTGKDTLESLSARIRVADSPSIKLSLLSKLTRQIVEHYPDAESSHFISFVFSEYLGDLWSFENSEMAHQCYDKALEFANDTGRILRKKKEIFVKDHDYTNAIKVIDMLVASEPRKIEMSKLYIEKTEHLLVQEKIEEATQCALLAATSDRHSSRAVVLLAQAFALAHKFTEAVQSLDDFLSVDHPGMSAKQQAEFNALIGEIWLKNLNAPEIALNRFVSATTLDPEYAPHLKLLSLAQEQVGLVQDQVSTLEKYLSMAESQDDAAAIRWVNEKLIKIYSSGEGVFYSQRIAVLRRLLAQATPTYDEILEIGQNFGSHDEWKITIQVISEKIPHISNESEGGLICALLGEKAESLGIWVFEFGCI